MQARIAVIGHVEWVDFAIVPRLPHPGEILHVAEFWDEAAGGGAVAVVQMAKLAGSAVFITALARDDLGERTKRQLAAQGVTLHAGTREGRQRRAFTYLTADGERTITVLGERIVPWLEDPLPWDALATLDGVYLTGGDPGAVRAARAARMLVATPRALDALAAAEVQLDVLVRSATDPGEAYEPGMLDPAPRFVVSTRGEHGGSWTGETSGSWKATPLPGPPVDAYGCGDSFAAALAFGLGAGMDMPAEIDLAARCGAACLCGRGPYAGQLELA